METVPGFIFWEKMFVFEQFQTFISDLRRLHLYLHIYVGSRYV